MCECVRDTFSIDRSFSLYIFRSIVYYDGVVWISNAVFTFQLQLSHTKSKNQYEWEREWILTSNLAWRKLCLVRMNRPLSTVSSNLVAVCNCNSMFMVFFVDCCGQNKVYFIHYQHVYILVGWQYAAIDIVIWFFFVFNIKIEIFVSPINPSDIASAFSLFCVYVFVVQSIQKEVESKKGKQKIYNWKYCFFADYFVVYVGQNSMKYNKNLIIKLMAKCHTVIVLNGPQAH